MANYNDNNEWVANAQPKGERKAKKVKDTGKPSKIVKAGEGPDLTAARLATESGRREEARDDQPQDDLLKVKKKTGGAAPRQSGNRVERLVAAHLGGKRIPGSGAIKNSNHNLEGDVMLKDDQDRPFMKLEIKASGMISAKGEKSYNIKLPELQQMEREASNAHEKGAFVFHFKGEAIDNSWVIMSMAHFKELVDEAKLGRTARQ